ncbi:MAG: hypothetical protein ACI9IP_001334 [Arcticibacterium sp.]|jgi:hypothetical protein
MWVRKENVTNRLIKYTKSYLMHRAIVLQGIITVERIITVETV